MGCTQNNLEHLRERIISLSDLVETVILGTQQQHECFENIMKQIEIKSLLIKKQLSIINKNIVKKEDIQAFANLNQNYQNQLSILNKKVQGRIFYNILEMYVTRPRFEYIF